MQSALLLLKEKPSVDKESAAVTCSLFQTAFRTRGECTAELVEQVSLIEILFKQQSADNCSSFCFVGTQGHWPLQSAKESSVKGTRDAIATDLYLVSE